MSEIKKHLTVILVTMMIPLGLMWFDASTIPGLILIWQSPSILVTDYFTVGGFSAAIANLWITTGVSAWLVLWIKAPWNGVTVAGLFTIAGFAVFGKTPINVLPIWIGITLYARVSKTLPSKWLAAYLFGTAIGPIVSYLWIIPPYGALTRLVLGLVGGIITGYLIPIISVQTAKLHQGYNLYNIGFTIGIIGSFFAFVFRLMGWSLSHSTPVDGSHHQILLLLLMLLFTVMLTISLWLKVNKEQWRALIKDIGVKQDFSIAYGWGPTLLNMALLGYLSLVVVTLLDFELHGPMVAGVLTVVGFGAFGKHIVNVLPLMIGAFLIGLSPWVDGTAVGPSIAVLFVTALAPISLKYGVVLSILAGMLHVFLGPYGLFLQGGFALYNNGFVAGFVAILMVQVFRKWQPSTRLKKGVS